MVRIGERWAEEVVKKIKERLEGERLKKFWLLLNKIGEVFGPNAAGEVAEYVAFADKRGLEALDVILEKFERGERVDHSHAVALADLLARGWRRKILGSGASTKVFGSATLTAKHHDVDLVGPAGVGAIVSLLTQKPVQSLGPFFIYPEHFDTAIRKLYLILNPANESATLNFDNIYKHAKHLAEWYGRISQRKKSREAVLRDFRENIRNFIERYDRGEEFATAVQDEKIREAFRRLDLMSQYHLLSKDEVERIKELIKLFKESVEGVMGARGGRKGPKGSFT